MATISEPVYLSDTEALELLQIDENVWNDRIRGIQTAEGVQVIMVGLREIGEGPVEQRSTGQGHLLKEMKTIEGFGKDVEAATQDFMFNLKTAMNGNGVSFWVDKPQRPIKGAPQELTRGSKQLIKRIVIGPIGSLAP